MMILSPVAKVKALIYGGIAVTVCVVAYNVWDKAADRRVDEMMIEQREAVIEKKEEANELRSRPVLRDRAIILERLR